MQLEKPESLSDKPRARVLAKPKRFQTAVECSDGVGRLKIDGLDGLQRAARLVAAGLRQPENSVSGCLIAQKQPENYIAACLAAALIARIWCTKAASFAGKAASFRLPIRAKVSGLPPSSAVRVSPW